MRLLSAHVYVHDSLRRFKLSLYRSDDANNYKRKHENALVEVTTKL
jgi:hypothetical protein